MTNNQNTVYQEWRQKYPLCFERDGCCMAFGLEHGAGWNPIIEELLQKIEAHLAAKKSVGQTETDSPFQIDQIKEKFGTLRFYVSGGDEQIFQWIIEAEEKTESVCEVCGKPATLHRRKGVFIVRTLCPDCADENYQPYAI